MRIIVTLDDKRNAHRSVPWETLRADVRILAQALAPIASGHQLVIVCSEQRSYDHALGRLIEQELGNLLPVEIPFATLQMMIEVDRYDSTTGRPKPLTIFELNPIRWLLEHGTVVICAGGGAATVYARGAHRRMSALDADVGIGRCGELLARKLNADLLVFAGTTLQDPELRPIRRASPRSLAKFVDAGGDSPLLLACEFVAATGAAAALGPIEDVRGLVAGDAGLTIVPRGDVVYAD